MHYTSRIQSLCLPSALHSFLQLSRPDGHLAQIHAALLVLRARQFWLSTSKHHQPELIHPVFYICELVQRCIMLPTVCLQTTSWACCEHLFFCMCILDLSIRDLHQKTSTFLGYPCKESTAALVCARQGGFGTAIHWVDKALTHRIMKAKLPCTKAE